MDSTCVVFTCDSAYLYKFVRTAITLRNEGAYKGEICLVIGDDLKESLVFQDPVFQQIGLTIVHFPNFVFPSDTKEIMRTLDRPEHWFPKIFQYHKFHLFNSFFKQWRRILYLDCGIRVLNPIQPLLDCWKENTLLAHSDAHPTYEWKLSDQFVHLSPYIDRLKQNYNLSIDYPQSTMMLYDTNIIDDSTEQNLYRLMLQYPNSRTNDQGIIALYFTNIQKCWQQIPYGNEKTNFYDYLDRGNGKPYIMLKSC